MSAASLRQALENDRLIDQLSADPQLAKTAYRKTEPWHPKWVMDVLTWPYVMRLDLVAAVLVTVLLMVWSITLTRPRRSKSHQILTLR